MSGYFLLVTISNFYNKRSLLDGTCMSVAMNTSLYNVDAYLSPASRSIFVRFDEILKLIMNLIRYTLHALWIHVQRYHLFHDGAQITNISAPG